MFLRTKKIVKYRDEWFDPDEKEVKGVVIFMNGDDENGFIFESITLDDIEDLLKMKYKSTNGIEFAKAFDAVQYAMLSGVKVGIYNNKGNFVRWLV